MQGGCGDRLVGRCHIAALVGLGATAALMWGCAHLPDDIGPTLADCAQQGAAGCVALAARDCTPGEPWSDYGECLADHAAACAADLLAGCGVVLGAQFGQATGALSLPAPHSRQAYELRRCVAQSGCYDIVTCRRATLLCLRQGAGG